MLHCQLAVGIMIDGSRANRLIEHFEVWRAVHITATGNQYSLRRTAQSRQRWHQIEGAELVDSVEFFGTIVSDGRHRREVHNGIWLSVANGRFSCGPVRQITRIRSLNLQRGGRYGRAPLMLSADIGQ